LSEKHDSFQITQTRKNGLIGIYHSEGYQAVLDIVEHFCNMSENELIAIHPSDHQAVLAQQAIVHAQRDLFQKFVAKIDFIMKEETATDKDNQRFKEAAVAQLMSALPITDDPESFI
jgi:hypothetical protein